MNYKGVTYEPYPEYAAILVETVDRWKNDIDSLIHSTILTELLGHLRPENVIVDERLSARPPDYMIEFLEKRLYKDARDYGVRRIIYILSDKEKRYAAKAYPNRSSFVYLCTSLNEALEIIKKGNEQVKINRKKPSIKPKKRT